MNSPHRVGVPTVTKSGVRGDAAFRRSLLRAESSLRRALPWIGHPDAWAVLVSEVMLQQTQSQRVVEPWNSFLERFPTPKSCAEAPLSDVLRLWSGLGFPRRAKALHEAASQIVSEHGGEVPRTYEQLRRLPGVGDYTASAVASFAFHLPHAVIDTNVGRVLARAVANRPLSAKQAREAARDLLPPGDSAQFNQSMIDLGAQFCRSSPDCARCPMKKVCRWQLDGGPDPAPRSAGVSIPQTKFAGSDRQLRGRVLREVREGPLSRDRLRTALSDVEEARYTRVLDSLERDGLIRRGRRIGLAGD